LQALGRHRDKAKTGQEAGPEPDDPLVEYNELLSNLFENYALYDFWHPIPRDLYIMILGGIVIPFHELSSGEKEVFFILSFFLRQSVTNAMIILDEPELHLHPEMSRLLVKHIQLVRPGNQIWLATHNAEIIDEVGLDRTLFVARDQSTRRATVHIGAREPEAHRRLREFFGFSGYVAVGKSPSERMLNRGSGLAVEVGHGGDARCGRPSSGRRMSAMGCVTQAI
jgi:hypothetical protein